MLSSVLRSTRAIHVNIGITRAFVALRELAVTHRDLAAKLDGLERTYDAELKVVFDAIRKLMKHPRPPRKPIGFKTKLSEAVAAQGYRVA